MPIIVRGIAPKIKSSGTFEIVLQGSGFTPKRPGAGNGDKVVITFQGLELEGRVERLIVGGCIAKVKKVVADLPATEDVSKPLKETVDDDLVEISITVTAEDNSSSGSTSELGLLDP